MILLDIPVPMLARAPSHPALGPGRLGAKAGATVLAVHEDWTPDGAGNGLGTLYAYVKARTKAAAAGLDLAHPGPRTHGTLYGGRAGVLPSACVFFGSCLFSLGCRCDSHRLLRK